MISKDDLLLRRVEDLEKRAKAVPLAADVAAKSKIARAIAELDFLERRDALLDSLCRFTNEAANVEWSSREEFKSKLLLVFYHELQRLFVVYDRPSNCGNCNEYCSQQDALITISRQLELYGCVLHGSVHECTQKYIVANGQRVPVARQCPATQVSRQHELVCVFSGAVVGKRATQVALSSRDFSSDSASKRQQAGFQYVMMLHERSQTTDQYENADAIANRKRRERKRKERGADESSAALSSSGAARKFAVEHTNRTARLKLTEQQKHLLKTSYRVQQRSAQIIEEAEKRARAAAESIMDDVLFDAEVRELLNTREFDKMQKKMQGRLAQYHQLRKREKRMPVLTRCIEEFLTPRIGIRLLRIVERDRAQIERVSRLSVRLWDICQRSPARATDRTDSCTFKQLVLAVLYAMRTGLRVPASGAPAGGVADEYITIVPYDTTLCVDLPDESMLRFLGAEQRERIRSEMTCASSRRGTGETAAHHYETQQSAAKRRKKQRKNASSFNSRRIDVPGLPPLTERDLTPEHLLDEAIGNNSRYSSKDVTTGTSFINTCVYSFDRANLPELAKLLSL